MIQKKDIKTENVTTSSNIIGKGTILTGNIETYGNVRIEGKVVGNVKTKSKVAFGHSCQVEGNIVAQNAEVEGNILGTIEVSELLVLKATAVIEGDIITNKMIVESGANFNGTCKMGVKAKEIKIGDSLEEKPLLRAQ